ncbi:peptide ABC transporter ATP-binding protein [Hypericibacter terrae]|uniref:Peptide ABC transporter ATP-binding protein n=1 Tax=Hypericibacter terrae TaxID=2602015 RepID=A0A5J6MEP4_9PROT|nr:DMT family transporter [Hypericibacter terrae]QEX15882.1 peptide ABC transporter ATP-binding protein [Hypericibacter terrae]
MGRLRVDVLSKSGPRGSRRFRGDLLAAIAPAIFLLLWSSGFGVAKTGLMNAEPLTFLTLRYGIIVLVFLPIFLVMQPRLPASRMAWLHIAVVGFLIQSVYFGLAWTGLGLGVSAGVAAVISSTQPLLVALMAPRFAKERVGALRWAGLLLGAAGAITVIVASASFGTDLDIGILCCAVATLGMAGATLYQKRFVAEAHPVVVNLVHYAVGLVTMAPLAFGFETMQVDWTPDFILSLGWIVGANSILAISLLLFMINRSEASRISALFFLVPPTAALFGWLLLGETLPLAAGVGMAVAVAGVWLVSRSA